MIHLHLFPNFNTSSWTFNSTKFCTAIGGIRIELMLARLFNDDTTYSEMKKTLARTLHETAINTANGSIDWDPQPWLSHYPEYREVFDYYFMQFDPDSFETEMHAILDQCMERWWISGAALLKEFASVVDMRVARFQHKPHLAKQYLETAKAWGYKAEDVKPEKRNSLPK